MNSSQKTAETSVSSPVTARFVEAQGWVVDDNGEIWFVASVPNAFPKGSWQNSTFCRANESH